MKQEKVLVSACLLGIRTRYDGSASFSQKVLKLCKTKCCIPVCPEQLAGFSTPRPPMEFRGGDAECVLKGWGKIVRVESGEDVTLKMLKGAKEALKLLEITGGVAFAILKERSPSCGVNKVYVDGEIVDGTGIFAYLLKKEGVKVYSEEELS